MTLKIRGIELNYDDMSEVDVVIVRFDYVDNIQRTFINGNISISYNEYMENSQITKLAEFTKSKLVDLLNK